MFRKGFSKLYELKVSYLISKQNCQVVTSPKKRTKHYPWCVSISFFGEVKARQFSRKNVLSKYGKYGNFGLRLVLKVITKERCKLGN